MSQDFRYNAKVFGTHSTATDVGSPDNYCPSNGLGVPFADNTAFQQTLTDGGLSGPLSWTTTCALHAALPQPKITTDDMSPPTAAQAAGDHHLSTPHPSLGGGMVSLIAGTLVETLMGDKLVETLSADDLIVTRDHGLQSIHWVGQTTEDVQAEDAPIGIAAGTFGNAKDLVVSPQQAILLDDDRAEMFMGKNKALVRAVDLLNHAGVTRLEVGSVTYVHVLIDAGQMVRADGIWSESQYPDDETLFAPDDCEAEEPTQFYPARDAFDTRFEAYDLKIEAA